MDTVGLYSSILHGEGLEAIRGRWIEGQYLEVATESLVELASLVLENSYFEFNYRVFRQKLGTAIGTKFAQAYASLFMNRLEERLLVSWDKIPLVWMRYIDDIFFIWTLGEDCLQEFISYLSSSHRTIKFTSEYSAIALNFLGVSIKVGVGGAPGTDFSASLLIPISTCIANRDAHGIPKKPFPLVRPSEYVQCAQIIAVFKAGWESFLSGLKRGGMRNRGGARNFPTGGLTLPTRGLKYGF